MRILPPSTLSRRTAPAVLLLIGLAVAAPGLRARVGPATRPVHPTRLVPVDGGLVATPARLALRGPYSEAHLLVGERRSAAGDPLDVTSRVAYSVADRRIASVDATGGVRPLANGETTLVVRLGPQIARIPIEVRGVAGAGPPRFLTEVLPVLTRAGCNQGACHGSASGKGGFKLSLFGYDPDWDYDALTRQNGARRVTPSDPASSLILRKPTLTISHRGGKRFDVGSPEYRLLLAWIAGGMPGPAPSEPKVTRLDVVPAARSMAVGESQRFAVLARYDDGSRRDVTGQTLFTSSDESVVGVTPDGEAKAAGPGEGAVVIRYRGLVAIARVTSPFGRPRPFAARSEERPIDRLVRQRLCALGLSPSGPSSDADFLRRATLDAVGLLPTPDEVRSFLASRDPEKRERLVDSLLARPEYVDFWTTKWGDILRSSRDLLGEKGVYAFNQWIRGSVKANVPWDRFARDLLMSQGGAYESGAASFYLTARKPEELAEATSQIFLGVRIQCARCHNHPYDKWTQNQYYSLAAFFARVRTKNASDPDEPVVFLADRGEVKHPKTRKPMAPCALDAAPASMNGAGDRRRALVDWMTGPNNPFFAREIVNRIWRHFMGQGLVEPVDDLRATNPASNEALFDWLARDFVRHGYDLKYLVRSIMLSETYQRSADAAPGSERDTRYLSHFPFKRLDAEPLLDALSAATGVPQKFDGFPTGVRADELPDAGVPSYFLDLFGRPARQTTCECERVDAPNTGQVLHLMNGADVNARLSAKTGRVKTLMEADLTPQQAVDEAYLATVSRFPTPDERHRATRYIADGPNRRRAVEDLFWALLNSREFLFNH